MVVLITPLEVSVSYTFKSRLNVAFHIFILENLLSFLIQRLEHLREMN